jgi:hypothetical protein
MTSLSLIKNHAMRMYGGVERGFQTLFILALKGGCWTVSKHDRFAPKDKACYVH